MKATAAILEILKRDGRTDPSTGISTADLIAQVHQEVPGLFVKPPPQGSAASIMTTVYREQPHVHRQKEGAAYRYWYDESKTEPKVIERSNRSPAVKKIKAANANQLPLPFKKLPFKKLATVKLVPKPVVKRVTATWIEATPPAAPADEFQIVKHLSGEPAGVVHKGILFTTLEQLVQTLNGKLRST